MNLNEIYGRLQEIDLGAAVTAIQSRDHALTQAEMIGLIVAAAVGLLFCLFGLKLVRMWAALLGLAVGFAGGCAAASAAGLNETGILIAGAAAGIIVAALGAALYRVGVFITVFLSVGFFVVRIVGTQDWIMLAVCAGIALIAAILAVKFVTVMTIFATAVCGAVTAGPAVYYLIPETGAGHILSIVLCAVFGALGVWVQLLLESRRRKKKNLEKAAEIRAEHSTANEVERARAMMDELDGAEESSGSGTEERETRASGLDKDNELETVSLDDIEEIDEDDL